VAKDTSATVLVEIALLTPPPSTIWEEEQLDGEIKQEGERRREGKKRKKD